MFSERRIRASRANGALARSSKTQAGIERSRLNGVKRDAFSTALAKLRDEYFAVLRPTNPIERDLVEEMIVAKWLRDRYWRLENSTINYKMDEQKAAVEAKHHRIYEPFRTAIAHKDIYDNSSALSHIQRSQAANSRCYHRALRELQDLRTNAQFENEQTNLVPDPDTTPPAHVCDAEVQMANHLITEKSPYLQQHAHNPVDWYPWGPEAFDKARREQKPIFLSIGYSTCHWCHVMERESFENEAIAQLVNKDFVPIKVDREERPDVDHIYMTFVQATTGSGGWPMSVFLTPDLEPFYGGTYFPPDNRYGRPGFPALLAHIAGAWRNDREKIISSGGDILAQLRKLGEDATPAAIDRGVLDACFHYFRRTFDRTRGGFGEAPKFPRPSVLNFLLRYYKDNGNEEALEMVLQTLASMAGGGMNDQLGGGFHRYSVDERWFVPHFEKMLYDQAQLATSYLEAFQITQEPFFGQIAESIFEYVLRDLTSPEGGFYSAEDADSAVDPAKPKDKSEGAFYLWSYSELVQLLGEETARIFSLRYGVEKDGNVENDPHGEFTHKNILYIARSIKEVASQLNQSEPTVESALDNAQQILLEARSRRPARISTTRSWQVGMGS